MAEHDALPFDGGSLEVDEQQQGPSGSPEIVETLRQVLVAEALDALQFDEEGIFNEQIGHRMRQLAASPKLIITGRDPAVMKNFPEIAPRVVKIP
jgi:hypothetical protein